MLSYHLDHLDEEKVDDLSAHADLTEEQTKALEAWAAEQERVEDAYQLSRNPAIRASTIRFTQLLARDEKDPEKRARLLLDIEAMKARSKE